MLDLNGTYRGGELDGAFVGVAPDHVGKRINAISMEAKLLTDGWQQWSAEPCASPRYVD